MQPINVLHLRDTHEIGGPGKTILETFRAIDADRFRLHLGIFLTRDESGDSPFVRAARDYGMPVHFIRGYNQYDPRMIGGVVDLAKSLQADVLHAHEVKSDVVTLLAAARHRIPTMTTMHGWIANSRKQRMLVSLDKRAARWFDCVIAVSAPIRDEILAAGARPERVRLLHNAIVVERYRRTGERGFLQQLVGKPLSGPVIASIGRLSPEKGHLDLLEAVAMLSLNGGPKPSIVLAGDGPDRERLEARTKALGLESLVHFPGYVARPDRVLEETDLMVLPSHTEGLPNAALEALVMEVPVLATRVGGTPEVVEDGVTGRLVPPSSPRALADALQDFLGDPAPWKRMAARGREMVETDFNFTTRTRKLEAIYAELTERTR